MEKTIVCLKCGKEYIEGEVEGKYQCPSPCRGILEYKHCAELSRGLHRDKSVAECPPDRKSCDGKCAGEAGICPHFEKCYPDKRLPIEKLAEEIAESARKHGIVSGKVNPLTLRADIATTLKKMREDSHCPLCGEPRK